MARQIPLSQGYMATIDDEDYDLVAQYRWHAHVVPQRDGRRGDAVYACRSIQISPDKSRHQLMHHLVLGSRADTDHIDLDGCNNQKTNLRQVTRSQNSMNRRGKVSSACPFKGVSRSMTRTGQTKWRASIFVSGKAKHLGMYWDASEAARAYDEAAKQYFGEFALLNFPTDIAA